VNAAERVLALCDLDLLLELARESELSGKLGRAGFALAGVSALERERARVLHGLDRRWANTYERCLGRYGRGVTLVRERVCQGCFVTLPTCAAPPFGEAELHLCESCGRLLYWR